MTVSRPANCRPTLWGNSGDDLIAGNANDNTLVGKAGDDTINAGGGNDAAHGGGGNDTIDGGDGNDLLYGGDGDDILIGGNGLDTLNGGLGADTYLFESASAFNDVDGIDHFNTSEGDVIDLTDVMGATAYDPLQDAITDWIEFTTSGSDTVVGVDRDGAGTTYSFDQVAVLRNVTGLEDEAALVTSGNLLAA